MSSTEQKLTSLVIVLAGLICGLFFNQINIKDHYRLENKYLKQELKQTQKDLENAKEQIKVLEDNQILYYYTDSWGGEELEEEVYENASQVLSFER